MARLQNQKRKPAGGPSRADYQLKKLRTEGESELETWQTWEYPPEFYDRLSKISLTRRALRELNRRTGVRHSHPSPPARPNSSLVSNSRLVSNSSLVPNSRLVLSTPRDLLRFSRHGGPDLRDLQGYPHPPDSYLQPIAMTTSRSSPGRGTKSSDPASTLPTSTTTKSKKSSHYDRNFDLHLAEHAIHPTFRSRKPDLEEVRANLAHRRPSLSPSRFSERAFEAFQEKNERATDEDDVLANVIPIILGGQTDRYCARNTLFNNLDSLTDGTTAAPNPDIYWGSYPDDLARCARDELNGHIIPSTTLYKPMAPNCFIEVKGPDGSLTVAIRQVRYIGANGSRGMHSLQNYGIEEPQYDGRPYTFNTIYHGGHLHLYAHHITAPTIEGGQPEYHTTQVAAYCVIGDRQRFIEGVSALRNTIDLAEKYRVSFIENANARASRLKVIADRDGTNKMEIPPNGDSPEDDES